MNETLASTRARDNWWIGGVVRPTSRGRTVPRRARRPRRRPPRFPPPRPPTTRRPRPPSGRSCTPFRCAAPSTATIAPPRPDALASSHASRMLRLSTSFLVASSDLRKSREMNTTSATSRARNSADTNRSSPLITYAPVTASTPARVNQLRDALAAPHEGGEGHDHLGRLDRPRHRIPEQAHGHTREQGDVAPQVRRAQVTARVPAAVDLSLETFAPVADEPRPSPAEGIEHVPRRVGHRPFRARSEVLDALVAEPDLRRVARRVRGCEHLVVEEPPQEAARGLRLLRLLPSGGTRLQDHRVEGVRLPEPRHRAARQLDGNRVVVHGSHERHVDAGGPVLERERLPVAQHGLIPLGRRPRRG